LDLRPSPSERSFRGELRRWLEREVPAFGPPPPPGDWPARRAYDTGWQRKLCDAGWAGVHWPTAYGGRGASGSEQLVYYEELTRARAPYIGANFIGIMHGGPTLIALGTPEQKARHLPRILRGEEVWCQGFSEPGAGSDLAAVRTRAERRGDHYRVNGHKIWTTRAQIADYCELLCRTDPSAPRHEGLTWLVLPMRSPGVVVRPLATLEGEGEFSEVFLEDVRVPLDHRVGEEGQGWRVANVTLRFERGTAFSAHIAALRRLLADLRAQAARRPRSGGSAWEDAGLRRELGLLAAEVDGLWALLRLCVCESERSGLPSLTGSAIKLRFSDVYERIGHLALRLLGRAGLSRADLAGLPAGELLHHYLWSISFSIAAGTTQIQKNIISERILGMPRDRTH
jgi:alkylation response protein AidB-like acyl-CoA dehydrogenase